jgi:hypothetical protein
MEIGIMGKFPWIYGTMPWSGGRQVKIAPTFSGHGGQGARGVACWAKGSEFKSCRIFWEICLLNFHLGMVIVKSWTWEFGWENLHVEMKMLPCTWECNRAPPSIDGNLNFEFLQCNCCKTWNIGICAKCLSMVRNNWWSCVHSDVLSARGNLFVWIQIFHPIVGLWRMGGGESKTDCV